MRRTPVYSVLVVALFVLPAGCQVDYLAHVAFGQLGVLASMVPVDQALQDERLTEDERAKLQLTQLVRQYGIDTVGLVAGDSYTVFEMNGDEPAAYVLSASQKESLTPYYWSYPFLGLMESKGFFDEAFARREAEQLLAMDLDVFLGRAGGFSTLGFFPDPVRQSNLQSDEIELAELILHEMTHSTVFKADDLDFDESLATFVGRTAAQAWFDETYGAHSDEAAAARTRFADTAVVDEYVTALYERMQTYYDEAAARGDSREVILATREEHYAAMRASFTTDYLPRIQDQERWQSVGETELDNASLLVSFRYQGSLSVYRDVLDKLNGDFPAAIEVYKEAITHTDAKQFLQDWVRQH